jgi:hypothetical protein
MFTEKRRIAYIPTLPGLVRGKLFLRGDGVFHSSGNPKVRILSPEGLIVAVLASRPHPDQGFRTCLGILRSYRSVDPARVEAVSARALELGAFNCKSVASLLTQKRDKAAANDGGQASLFDHANVRGPGYYH